MLEEKSAFEVFESGLNKEALDYLKESAKWSKVLAIFGFIGVGLMVVVGLIMIVSSAFSGIRGVMPSIAVSILYFLFAAVYAFPIYYLYCYANNINKGIKEGNQKLMTNGFEFLKSHHKFLAITMIVVASLYLLFFIGVIFASVGSFI